MRESGCRLFQVTTELRILGMKVSQRRLWNGSISWKQKHIQFPGFMTVANEKIWLKFVRPTFSDETDCSNWKFVFYLIDKNYDNNKHYFMETKRKRDLNNLLKCISFVLFSNLGSWLRPLGGVRLILLHHHQQVPPDRKLLPESSRFVQDVPPGKIII